MKAQKHYNAAAGKVADLETRLAEAATTLETTFAFLRRLNHSRRNGRCGHNRRGHASR